MKASKDCPVWTCRSPNNAVLSAGSIDVELAVAIAAGAGSGSDAWDCVLSGAPHAVAANASADAPASMDTLIDSSRFSSTISVLEARSTKFGKFLVERLPVAS